VPDFDIVVLGDCNPDLVLQGGEVEPAFGQAERLVEDAKLLLGGSGAIFACGAARLGLRTAITGVVGDDLFGRFMLDRLVEHGVDTRALGVDPGVSTGVTVVLAKSEDRAILTFPGAIADRRVTPTDIDLACRARHVHVASLFLQKGLAPELSTVFEAAHRAGASTSIDPNWDPGGLWNGALSGLLELTDFFLPNRAEATRIAGRDDVAGAAATLSRLGPTVVVKLGAEGALAVRDGAEVHAGAYGAVAPLDTTGAGDSFDAGFVAAQLNGWSLERSLVLGCVCGALSTRAAGGTAAQPTWEEAVAALEVVR
jgi:sugar/nucleoside kinase (ribokinase family)